MRTWKEIRTHSDIDSLMNEFCGFHDCCIVSANYSTGSFVDTNGTMKDGNECDKVLCISFDSQAVKKKLKLRFIGVRSFGFVGWQKGCFCNINGCYLEFDSDSGLIIWADSEDFLPQTHISPVNQECSYVTASSLEWNLE